jgi:hypothetical protein
MIRIPPCATRTQNAMESDGLSKMTEVRHHDLDSDTYARHLGHIRETTFQTGSETDSLPRQMIGGALVSEGWKRPERLRSIRLNIESRIYASRLHVPHLRTATGPFIHGEKRFSGRPGLSRSHFGRLLACKQSHGTSHRQPLVPAKSGMIPGCRPRPRLASRNRGLTVVLLGKSSAAT